MLFNSPIFLFLFLPVVLGLFFLARRFASLRAVVAVLLVSSLFYYGWWKPTFLLLLVGSIVVNYLLGERIIKRRMNGNAKTKTLLIVGVLFNLASIIYFKYAGFLISNANGLFGTQFGIPDIVLPIGISFFTFQQIAFLVDAHQGKVSDVDPLRYALFITFFPQLIAGPIVHHAEFLSQLQKEGKERDGLADLALGISIFVVGLFKKVVVADTFAVYADAGYASLGAGHALSTASGWVVVLSYSLQLYYDFSGYSDMAVGLGRMFGIKLPVNFLSPYRADSIIEFWRRWHITLSRFFRDYVYFPLGGSRVAPWRNAFNLFVVMLLVGLWHGANWTFVIWGGMHGALLAVNHGWKRLPWSGSAIIQTRAVRALSVLGTFLVVTLAWVPFRSNSVGDSLEMFRVLFGIQPDASLGWGSGAVFLKEQFGSFRHLLDPLQWAKPREMWPAVLPPDFLASVRPVGGMLLLVGVLTFVLPNVYEIFRRFDPVLYLPEIPEQEKPWSGIPALDWKVAMILSGMFVLALLHLSRVSPFLYFQF